MMDDGDDDDDDDFDIVLKSTGIPNDCMVNCSMGPGDFETSGACVYVILNSYRQ